VILPTHKELIDFWTDAGIKAWFGHDPAFDAALHERFEAAHLAAARGELENWGEAPESALALLLLFDQIPRNIYRGSAHAFATDGMARALATRAVDAGFDLAAPLDLQIFFYLPFEHTETAAAQARGVALCEAYAARGGDESYPRYARIHADIIARFGRFPHRNAILGRKTTLEEAAFLAAGGFKG
jgi:uncharacterized protein (DUF924 family)